MHADVQLILIFLLFYSMFWFGFFLFYCIVYVNALSVLFKFSVILLHAKLIMSFTCLFFMLPSFFIVMFINDCDKKKSNKDVN